MKYLIYLLPAFIVCSLAWLTGFDFDERGAEAFIVGLFVVMFTGALIGVMYELEK